MKKIIHKMLHSKVAISTVGLAVIISMAIAKYPSKENNFVESKSKVIPPLKNVDIEYKNYSIDAKQGSRIKYYETGSIISIPANAFVDENGEIIVGKVDIQYREFHNPVDFFVSGIPMTYDSAGTQYQFESAGMLEILAFQHGKPVFLGSEKKVVVEMMSPQRENKYNIYQYNNVSGNWKYVYKDKAYPTNNNDSGQFGEEKTSIMLNTISQNTELNNTANLLVPQKSNKQKFHFDVETDTSEFPEFALYKGTQFEVSATEKDFDPTYTSITWNDISLEKTKQNGSYLMTLSRGAESHTFQTVPVFDGKDYDQALVVYQKLYSKRKEKETKQQRVRDSIYQFLNKERLDRNYFASDAFKNAKKNWETQNLVVRIFIISGFGVWNSDCTAKLPKGKQLAATYTDTAGKKLTFNTLYLAEKGRNAMFAMSSYSRLQYNPHKKNILWTVTDDNKLAIFEEEDFEKIKIKNDSCIVKMKVINKTITKPDEVRAILKI